MAYQRKTRDRWDIETNYGYGWEVENSEYTRADASLSYAALRIPGGHEQQSQTLPLLQAPFSLGY